MTGGSRVLLACVLATASVATSQAGTALFDFDNGVPTLTTGMGLPLSQTAAGVMATFSGRFSIQSHDTTFYNLPNFSGNYLDPDDVYSPSLEIVFDHLLTGIMFDFATADFGLDTNTTLKLTAYRDSKLTPAVGSATATAVGEGWGLGVLTFSSATPFNLVDIVIMPGAGSDFLADNFSVTARSDNVVPEPGTIGMVALAVAALGFRYRRQRR